MLYFYLNYTFPSLLKVLIFLYLQLLCFQFNMIKKTYVYLLYHITYGDLNDLYP